MTLINILHKQKWIFYFILTFFCITLLYRVSFIFNNHQTTIDPIPYLIAVHSFGLISDSITCLFLLLLLGALRFILKPLPNQYKNSLHTFFISFTFISMSLIYLANQKIFSTLFIGINSTLLIAYFHQGLSSLDLYSYLTRGECLILLSTLLLYPIITLIPYSLVRRILFFAFFPFLLLASLWGAMQLAPYHLDDNNRFIATYSNPINYILYTYYKSINRYNYADLKLDPHQEHIIKLIDTAFLTKKPLHHSAIAFKNQDTPYNVVIFVLESVGSDYIFNKINGQIPMPFLKLLSTNGVWFNNHYSAGNISALGEFSLFTGLYPNPTPTHFEMQNSIHFPTIASWFDKQYDSFLVSASNNLYFSMGLNKTFAEYDNASTIDPARQHLFFDMFLDENTGFQFFNQRLARAKSPFLAVYWSGAAHFPYKDYSSTIKITNPTDSFSRYINSLALLDQEIKATYEQLKQQHLLDHTVFIIAGDHGESFTNQHHVFLHGRSLYQPEIKTPLLIYAPTIIKPHAIQHMTSTIDLLPTLLDIFRIPHAQKLQGESIFQTTTSRDYIFTYGDEDDIAAIDHDSKKMIISFSSNTCFSYDLKRDPNELQPLACKSLKQQEAILKFRRYQPALLTQLNDWIATPAKNGS